MDNYVVLRGNVVQPPYFALVGEAQRPFMRLHLGVDPRSWGQVFLMGNLGQEPYYDQVGDSGRPFLRFYLAVDRAGADAAAGFFRVVMYDDRALLAYAYLEARSEVAVFGRLRARKRALAGGVKETVVEVVADDVTFLRHVNWQRGDAERARILGQRAGRTQEVMAGLVPAPLPPDGDGGDVDSEPHEDEDEDERSLSQVSAPARDVGRQQGRDPRSTDRETGFFRVVAYDDHALLNFPYLQPGSEIVVFGRLRTRQVNNKKGQPQRVVEVVVDDVTFLRKIAWEAGDEARARLLAARKGGQR